MKKSSTILNTFLLGLGLLLSAQLVQAKEVKQTFKGLTLNANLVMAEGKSFKDGMALLTHGTLTHSGRSTYANIQKLLAERGISSIAPNLSLGINDRHGEYDCSVPHRHLHEDALDEIGFWVDWLKKQGTDSLTLMGHSRGGNQTAWFSVERDDPIIKDIILIAPQTWRYQSEKADYQKKYNQSIDPVFAKAEKLVKAGKGETLIKDINFIYCKHTDATANSIVSYYKNEPKMDTPTLLKKATKPTLVIIGTEDKVVSDLSEKMAAVKNPQVHVAVIDGANHHFRDFFAEDLADQATDFIQAHQ
ncbi:alpha/beta hydrolase [Hydrogenovibrio sp. 3SP14C1]|uniref:alpha/beta hydrolase n=1 Tax=Hydrogenovibrio sp. 3SP14C1 TaxID=3038774 RepID=UPI002416BF8B|nr:alpha/beta hydrolase [Hydrogenovibrio sp. 3SP14C1]MDG4813536.1 alpha/beta hydrolase [Hydrogenovibrio sp. 3SP14C1]